MSEQGSNKKQSSQYDKVIKENLEITLPVIIRDILGLDIIKSEELPDDLQHTKERKPDALKMVTDTTGNTYVLQVEFQVKDENELVYRMAEYSIMLMRKYGKPIKQFVVFLREKVAIPLEINTTDHKYKYQVVRIAEANYQLFLRSDNPEVNMLGILASLGSDEPNQAVQAIVNQVSSLAEGELLRDKYFKQMRIFVQLRTHVEPHFIKAMQSVSTFFKEERDFLYKKGVEVKATFVIKNLLPEGFSNEKIAKIAGVSVDVVERVRKETEK